VRNHDRGSARDGASPAAGFRDRVSRAGGEDEAALARNVAALAEWRFLHRSMVDVSHRNASTSLFGR
jgi:isopentenyl diphosphate isomerase/L-lactate dehydrogenase-like FMN-dependent dehydrogenase